MSRSGRAGASSSLLCAQLGPLVGRAWPLSCLPQPGPAAWQGVGVGPNQEWPLGTGTGSSSAKRTTGPAYPGPEVEPVLSRSPWAAQRLVEFAALAPRLPGRPEGQETPSSPPAPHGGG